MIDIHNDFFLWVSELIPDGTNDFILCGTNFHGGLSAASPLIENRPIFVVTQDGAPRLAGRLKMVHRSRRGYVLEYRGGLDQFPGLITTKPEMRWVFNEPVGIQALDAPNSDTSWCFDELGCPLVGSDWVGVASAGDRQIILQAYACAGTIIGSCLRAFSPDWADSCEDEQGQFVIRRNPPDSEVILDNS